MDFDDPNPRSAPVPKSFSSVVPASSVPEVSLVFNPSPVSDTKLRRTHAKYMDVHSQNASPKDVINHEVRLRNNVHETMHKDKLVQRPQIHNVRNITSVNNVSPMKNQGHVDVPCVDEGLFENPQVCFPNYLPQSHIADLKLQEHVGLACRSKLLERKSPSEIKNSVSQNNYSQILRNHENYGDDRRERMPERSDLNVQYTTLQVNQMTAMEHPGNAITVNQRLDRRPSYHLQNTSENVPAVHPFHNQFTTGSQCCYTNHNLGNYNVSVNDGMAVSTNVPVHTNTNCVSHFSHPDPLKYGTHIPCVSGSETSRNLKIGNFCACQSNERVNVPTDVTRNCPERFEHCDKNNGDLCEKNPVNDDDQVLAVIGCSVLHQNSVYKYSQDSRMNVNRLEDGVCKQKPASHSCTMVNHREEVQREPAPSKNINNGSPSRKKFSRDQEKQNDRSCDSSVLQEIALMNQKQCSILQGLLQQVVAMQADQMKILSEINKKLSDTRPSEVPFPNTHAGTSEEFLQDNATTQTTFIERTNSTCQKCEEKNKVASQSVDNLSKKKPMNQDFCENSLESNKIFSTNKIMEQETDYNKSKKLQDRAVSWSAVHDVETVEESFTLHGVCVPTVVEQLPSSIHTMHLHVQDYNSAGSFDSITETRHMNDSKCYENDPDNHKGSWTLYDNIVGHVKKFLQTVPCEKNGSASQKTSQVEAIRFATIEKIRQLGVSVYENSAEIKEVNATGRIHFDSKVASHSSFHNPSPVTEKCSSDASLEIQTLALKYLQDDDLCELAKWNQSNKSPSILKTGQRSANISVATQHYLEKYHLLPIGTDKDKRHVNANCGQIYLEDNILDITTLKKQPKLL